MLDASNTKFYFMKWFRYKFYACSLSKFINLIIKSVWFNCHLAWSPKFFDHKIKLMAILWGGNMKNIQWHMLNYQILKWNAHVHVIYLQLWNNWFFKINQLDKIHPKLLLKAIFFLHWISHKNTQRAAKYSPASRGWLASFVRSYCTPHTPALSLFEHALLKAFTL